MTYPDIREYIQKHPERKVLNELGNPEVGWLAAIGEDAREILDVPDTATALVEWDDGDADDPTIEIRALENAEHATILNETTSTLVERVITHYEAHPQDDGHPAYQLYTEWQRRRAKGRANNNRENPEPEGAQ